jgi:hypothetical protein
MIQKYLIIVDERSQKSKIESIKSTLKSSGIDLIAIQFDPTNIQKRNLEGNQEFDKDSFIQQVLDLEYFKGTDVIACDYNLIEDELNGFQIIQILREIGYSKKKKIILYSAQIKDVIGNIIQSNADFEVQKTNLADIINCKIEFLANENIEQEIITNIRKTAPFDFEEELKKWFNSRENDKFNYLFPKYEGKTFKEIAIEIDKDTHQSAEFKKDLVEQIIAYLAAINGLS